MTTPRPTSGERIERELWTPVGGQTGPWDPGDSQGREPRAVAAEPGLLCLDSEAQVNSLPGTVSPMPKAV